jgi:hypothetical protein
MTRTQDLITFVVWLVAFAVAVALVYTIAGPAEPVSCYAPMNHKPAIQWDSQSWGRKFA